MNWRETVAALAPTIGTALGGPFGALAGTVLGSILGVKKEDGSIDSSLEALEKAVKGLTPEDYVKLKVAEQEFQTKMVELDIEKDKLSFNDRDSARKREMEVKDSTPKLLALLVSVGFFGLLVALMLVKDIPTSTHELLNTMVGACGTGWTMMLAYYFGSSRGSDSKNSVIDRLTGGDGKSPK